MSETETHVISALKEKRARIDGEIKNRRFQIMRLEGELAHVDAVIKMFAPDYDIEAILPKVTNRKNAAGTPRGSGTRDALTVLRLANEPLTTREIAIRVLGKLGKAPTREAVETLARTIHGGFSRRTDGAVRFDASVHPGKWSLN